MVKKHMHKARFSARKSIAWTALNGIFWSVGWSAGWALSFYLNDVVLGNIIFLTKHPIQLVPETVPALLAGCIIGVSQWGMLRRSIVGFGWWIPVTAMGMTLVGTVILGSFWWLGVTESLSLALLGILFGAIGQWRVIRRQGEVRIIMFPLVLLGWVVAVVSLAAIWVIQFIASLAYESSSPNLWPVIILTCGIAGLLYGGATAIALPSASAR